MGWLADKKRSRTEKTFARYEGVANASSSSFLQPNRPPRLELWP